MKFSCTQENLFKGLSILTQLAVKSINLPILQNILIEVKNNEIIFSSTNLEIGIKHNIRGKIEKEGSVTIPAKLLFDFVSLLPKQRVDFESDENLNIYISSGSYKTKIKGVAADEFPIIPDQEESSAMFLVDSKDLKNALSVTIFAGNFSDTRPELTGVYFYNQNNRIVLVSTDRYRLAEKKIDTKSKEEVKQAQTKVIIPIKAAQEVIRISQEKEEEVKILVGENQASFIFLETILVTRLIDATFPDYQQIIPEKINLKMIINRNEFIRAVKAAGLFSKTGIYDVKINFLPEEKEIVIKSENSQAGESEIKIKSEGNGSRQEVVLNYRYLLDGLQHIETNQITFEVDSSSQPVLIKPVKVEDFRYLVMPIKQ